MTWTLTKCNTDRELLYEEMDGSCYDGQDKVLDMAMSEQGKDVVLAFLSVLRAL